MKLDSTVSTQQKHFWPTYNISIMSSELGINRNTINKNKTFSNDFGPMKKSTTTRAHKKKTFSK